MIRLQLSKKLFRYILVGTATLSVYLIVGTSLDRLGVSIMWLAPLSFTAAVVVNYILQKMWVFQDSRPVFASLPKFFVMTLVGYLTNSLVLSASISHFSLPVAQLLAASTVVILNALFLFLWVFALNSHTS